MHYTFCSVIFAFCAGVNIIKTYAGKGYEPVIFVEGAYRPPVAHHSHKPAG